jgi:uncharacterized protein
MMANERKEQNLNDIGVDYDEKAITMLSNALLIQDASFQKTEYLNLLKQSFDNYSNSDCVEAIYNKAMCYEFGDGVDKNIQLALQTYLDADSKDITNDLKGDALYRAFIINKFVLKQDDKIKDLLERASAKGCADATVMHACLFKKKPENKYKIYKRYAIAGNPQAQYKLSVCYANGLGTAKSPENALKWLEKAAKHNYQKAIHELGMKYFDEKEYNKAFSYFVKASVMGWVASKFMLAVCLDDGLGTQVNKIKAFKIYEELSNMGNPDALYNLAMCYEDGEGVKQDKQKAKELFEMYKSKN